ncbi:MAG: hypothetical protein ACRDI2_24420, partial [Chloroflexota bacterium]
DRHRAVVRKLMDRQLLYLGHRLRDLLNLPELADYDLNARVDAALCGRALDLAAELVPRLRSL